MDNIINFLYTTKDALAKNNFNEIHIVIGNESCDLDSCISSLILAFYLNNYKKSQNSETTLVVPIQNVTSDLFLLRSDNCFVLKEAEIPLDSLIYRNDINLEKICKEKKVTTTLVDHHILSDKDTILADTVVQILDHRPVDPAVNWNKENIEIIIEEVGSCSTLVAKKIMDADKQILFKELAYMIYETIIYDTIGLLPEHGKAKELDIQIAKELECLFGIKEDRKVIYDRLWRAHNDVSHLTPKQLLFKDLKIVEKIPVPGLPMLVADFLGLENAYQSIKYFAEEHKTTLVLLIGLDAVADVKRDVAIFFSDASRVLKDNLLEKLNNSEILKGYNFLFSEVQTPFADIVCLRQFNVKLSRKQIIPLLKDCLVEK